LAAAYNGNKPGNFEQKHDKARALRLKTSLFGGRGESYRTKDGAVQPESEPEPESEAEAKANKPKLKGKCKKPAKTMDQCWAWAGNAGVSFTSSRALKKKKKFPTGCFFNAKKPGGELLLNTHRKGGSCSKKWGCVCESKHPEPEPEPVPEVAFEVLAGICKKLFTSNQCATAAAKVFKTTATSATLVSSTSDPKGCFVTASNEVKYNTDMGSLAECKHADLKGCVCPLKDTQVTEIKKTPGSPPATPGGSGPGFDHKDTYKLTKAKCVASNLVNKDECKVRAKEYIKKNKLKVKIKKFKSFSSSKWPAGCWILPRKKRVFFNSNPSTAVKCGNGGSWCMCKASFVIARKQKDCIHVITSPEECEDAARSKNINKKVRVKKMSKKWPKACFLRRGKLYFNTRNSKGKCGKRKTACICEA